MERSADNRHAKLIRSLGRKKGRTQTELFVAEGLRFVSDIPPEREIEFYAASSKFLEKNPEFPFRAGIEVCEFSEAVFDGLTDTVNSQGIIAVCKQQNAETEDIARLSGDATVFLLDGIKDPGNLGTIIRSADAAGMGGIILSNNSVDLYNPKVLRATMGSIFHLPIVVENDTAAAINSLRNAGFEIIGTSLDTEDFYFDIDYRGKKLIIIGSEADGISDAAASLCDRLAKIPIVGDAESLNAGVAASIIMYEALRQNRRKS